MNEIKLIAMDMDGTLLCNEADISEQNVNVLKQCNEIGVELVLCSGRLPDDAAEFIVRYGFKAAVIGLNGAAFLSSPESMPIQQASFTYDDSVKIMDAIQESGLTCGAYTVNSLYISNPEYQEIHWGTAMRTNPRLSVSITDEGKRAALTSGICKIVALAENAEDEPKLSVLKEKLKLIVPEANISSSWHDNIELNPAGSNKGVGLKLLAEAKGLTSEQVMAIGDNENDIPMLEYAGLAIAMENGTPETKAAADYVTLTNSDSGVAYAISKFVLQ